MFVFSGGGSILVSFWDLDVYIYTSSIRARREKKQQDAGGRQAGLVLVSVLLASLSLRPEAVTRTCSPHARDALQKERERGKEKASMH